MLPPPEKPWSIIRRTTSGRLRVAVLDAASDTSQATSRPLWRRTNGHSARRLPSRGLGLSAASGAAVVSGARSGPVRSEEHTSELQSLMRTSYAVFCLKQKNKGIKTNQTKRAALTTGHPEHRLC